MRFFIASLGVCAAVIVAMNVTAETVKVDMKPGLWQNDMKMSGEGAAQMQSMQQEQMKQAMEDMKKQMANLPPEQRKQMEQYMAQMGMKVEGNGMTYNNGEVSITPTSVSTKSCVTQAEIDRGAVADSDNDECTSTFKQLGKNRVKSTQVCGGSDPSTMEMEVVFDSPKHFTGKGVMKQTRNGKPYVIDASLEGTWLSSDCGDIEPDDEELDEE